MGLGRSLVGDWAGFGWSLGGVWVGLWRGDLVVFGWRLGWNLGGVWVVERNRGVLTVGLGLPPWVCLLWVWDLLAVGLGFARLWVCFLFFWWWVLLTVMLFSGVGGGNGL